MQLQVEICFFRPECNLQAYKLRPFHAKPETNGKKSIHISLKTVVFSETFLQFLYYTMRLAILKFYSSAGNGVG